MVDVPSSYNVIIERETQTEIHIRTNVKQLTITFEMEERDVVIYINQREASNVMTVTKKATLKESE